MSDLKFGTPGFYGLIDKRLNKWTPVTLQQADRDDIRQEAICRIFQMRRSQFSATLIETCVDRAIRQWRRVRNRTRYTSVFTSFDSRSSNETEPLQNEVRQGELSELDRIYLQIDMKKVLAELTPYQQKICRLLIENKTLRRIARYLNTSLRKIQQEIQEIRDTIEQAGQAL